VFTPLVLTTLVIYLIAVIGTGKDPYNDREIILLFGLSIVTVIVNGITLSAILFRISEWGITPNRLAVLGSNILILLNLFLMSYRLFKTVKDVNEIEQVGNSIAFFLPVYSLWTMIVTFVLPLLFNFK